MISHGTLIETVKDSGEPFSQPSTNNTSVKKILTLIMSLATTLWVTAIDYNDNVTAIFGSGNPDTGWTTSSGGGIGVSLRAKNRVTGSTANINGVYTYNTGTVPPGRAEWNWEWSINSASPLSDFDYVLGIDTDPSQGINYFYVNPLTFWSDNSYGNHGTGNGAGLEGPYTAFPDASVAQNSQNLVFVGGDPNLDATYNYILSAVQKGGPLPTLSDAVPLPTTSITVVVGKGGDPVASVPDSIATIPMLVLGFGGIIELAKRQKR